MKKGLVIAAVLTAVGTAILIGAIFASGGDLALFGGGKVEKKTYDIDGAFTSVEVDVRETDVVFKPSDGAKASVVCEERKNETYDVRVEDGTLKIGAKDGRRWFDFLTFFRKSVTMTVYIPAGEYDALTVKSGTGDVTVPGDFSFASADITASTGDVSFFAKVGGSLKIKTSTGGIDVEDTSAGNVELSVSTGEVTVASLECKAISVNVSTGRVTMSDVECESFASKGSTGKVKLKNVIAEGAVDVERSTGDVHFERCDAASLRIETSTGEVTGTLLSGKVFVTKTSTGDVYVPDSITGGRFEITTSTGDIEIRIED